MREFLELTGILLVTALGAVLAVALVCTPIVIVGYFCLKIVEVIF